MSIWGEVRDLATRSTWVERFVFAWTAVNAVVEVVRGDWSHAATYLLAFACCFSSAVWRLSTLNAEHSAKQWRRMFYDLRATYGARDAKRDAGSTTLGHALGVVVVLGGLLLLLAVAGAIEGGGL